MMCLDGVYSVVFGLSLYCLYRVCSVFGRSLTSTYSSDARLGCLFVHG